MKLRRKGKFNVDKATKIFKLSKSKMPLIIANDAKNHFQKGFRQDGGQTDKGKWRPRKHNPKGKRRGILIGRKGGRLWRSIGVIGATFSRIEVGSRGIIYAARHNEGLDGMPQREFLGKSKVLDAKTKETIRKEIRKVFGKR